jgi:hypothetical protein
MAAMTTCNPLCLSARTAFRGARKVTSAKAASKASKAAFTVRASDDDLMDVMGEIGLGEEMEDIMAKADGGRSVPKFVVGLCAEYHVLLQSKHKTMDSAVRSM